MNQNVRVTVWMEGLHEKSDQAVRDVYPDGMAAPIAHALESSDAIASVRIAHLGDEDQGLSDEILATTDVMTWWGHIGHDQLEDTNIDRLQQRVLDGMGLIVLHSAHFSKIFRRLMGTSCRLRWRDTGERERLWVVDPAHPIADGLPEFISLEPTEMYGEYFDIPQPDQLVFMSWFQGGEVFRSGCCWHRGKGKIFYFRPGHETFPIYHNEHVLRVIRNAVLWAAPTGGPEIVLRRSDPLEPIDAPKGA